MSLTTVDNKTKVPLQSVTVDATCIDNFARVEVSQHFRNDGEKSIEAVYRFPLDEQSAVCGFEANIDGKTIVAECQSKEKAFETYDKAISQGHGAYLAEEERGDVFTISVGNLPANKDVVVKLIYLTKLVPEGDDLRFSIPAAIGERYTPATSSSSFSKDGGMDSSDTAVVAPPTSSSAKYFLEVTLHMKMTAALKSVTSPTHPISFELGEEQGTGTVTLSQDTLMNNDVVFVIATRDPHRPTACCEISRDKEGAERTTAMMSIFPSFDTGHLTAESGEIIFLVDRSGSMSGSKMDQCKTALQLFLRSLPEGAKFNIVSFGSTHRSLFSDGPRPLGDHTLKEAADHVASMSANMGGTEILRPITDIVAEATKRRNASQSSKGSKQGRGFAAGFFSRRRSTSQSRSERTGDDDDNNDGYDDTTSSNGNSKTQVLVLTDGQVSNTQSVLREVAKAAGAGICRFFSLGIGNGASIELVAGIARNGRGVSETVLANENLKAKVMRQVRRATIPALEYADVTWLCNGKEIEKDEIVQSPETLPPVFSMDRFTAFATFGKSSKGKSNDVIVPDAARLTGKTPDGSMMTVTVNIPGEAVREGSILAKLAARETIRFLQDRRGDTARDEITSLALAHNLASRHTSFVAVEKRSEEAKVDSLDMELVIVPQVAHQSSSNNSPPSPVSWRSCGILQEQMQQIDAMTSQNLDRVMNRGCALDSIENASMSLQSASLSFNAKCKKKSGFGSFFKMPSFSGFFGSSKSSRERESVCHRKDESKTNKVKECEKEEQRKRGNSIAENLADAGFDGACIGRLAEEENEEREPCRSSISSISSLSSARTVPDPTPDRLISLQMANGRWTLTPELESLSCIDGLIATAASLGLSAAEMDILATIVALAILEQFHASARDEWDMLAEKSRAWISQKTAPPTLVSAAVRAARDAITHKKDVAEVSSLIFT